jgi:hypothetical protein
MVEENTGAQIGGFSLMEARGHVHTDAFDIIFDYSELSFQLLFA